MNVIGGKDIPADPTIQLYALLSEPASDRAEGSLGIRADNYRCVSSCSAGARGPLGGPTVPRGSSSSLSAGALSSCSCSSPSGHTVRAPAPPSRTPPVAEPTVQTRWLPGGVTPGFSFPAAQRRWCAGREGSASLQVKHDRGDLRPRRGMDRRDRLDRRHDVRRAPRLQAHLSPAGDCQEP